MSDGRISNKPTPLDLIPYRDESDTSLAVLQHSQKSGKLWLPDEREGQDIRGG